MDISQILKIVENALTNEGVPEDKKEEIKTQVLNEEVKPINTENVTTPDNSLNVEQAPDTPAPITANNDEPRDKYNMTKRDREWLFRYILEVEGKYFNHPNDPGGETMYGIIKSEARRHGYEGPMRELPIEKALDIYGKDYFQKFLLDKINHFGKVLCIFDFIVNSGNRGVSIAQKTVNKVYINRTAVKENVAELQGLVPLAEDGVMGPKTIDAINKIPFFLFYSTYVAMQEDKYEDLMRANGKLRSFDDGWENRIVRKNQFIYRLLKDGVITWY